MADWRKRGRAGCAMIAAMNQTLTLRYDRAAPRWRRAIARLGYNAAYDDLLTHLPMPPAGARIADVGCGSGAMMDAFVRRHGAFHALHLVDPSSEMLVQARKTLEHCPRLTCETKALDQIGTARFDVILCAHVIEHCPSTEAALRQLFEALRPGGWLILAASKPHWCTWALRRIWGHRAYAPDALLDSLHNAGFSNASTHAFSDGPPSRLSQGYIARKDHTHVHRYR